MNEFEIKELIYNRINTLNLRDFYDDTVIVSDSNIVANYNNRNFLIMINPNNIDKHLDKVFEIDTNLDRDLYREFYFKYVLYHELRHVYQNKLVNGTEEKCLLRRLLQLDEPSLDSGALYTYMHDLYVCERDADLSSLQELESCYKDTSIGLKVSNFKISKLIKGYNIRMGNVVYPRKTLNELRDINPVNKIRVRMINDLMEECDGLELYLRLYYGMPITLGEYVNLLGLDRKEKVLVK